MGNFYTDVIMKDARFTSTLNIRDPLLLEPTVRAAVYAIIREALASNIRLMITETYRSKERQILLFDKGLSKLKDVGVHHFGLACDFCKVLTDGSVTWAGDWAFLRDLAEKHGLISGLDWGQPGVRHTFVDPDHVQLATLAQQNALFAGTWYPPTQTQGEINA